MLNKIQKQMLDDKFIQEVDGISTQLDKKATQGFSHESPFYYVKG